MSVACNRHRSRIESAAWGRLDEGARSELLAHAERCPECAAALRFMERLRAERDGEGRALPPPVYFEGVLAEIHARMPAAPVKRIRARRRLVTRESFASGFLALIAIGWLGVGVGSGLVPERVSRAFASPLPSPISVAAPAAAQVAQAAAAARRAEVIFVAGLGWVRRDSELLRMTRGELAELGLVPPVARG